MSFGVAHVNNSPSSTNVGAIPHRLSGSTGVPRVSASGDTVMVWLVRIAAGSFRCRTRLNWACRNAITFVSKTQRRGA